MKGIKRGGVSDVKQGVRWWRREAEGSTKTNFLFFFGCGNQEFLVI